ncbi:hypothetical protein GCM10027612_35170 [Microbispora bryophytorum subsp. camponoti]
MANLLASMVDKISLDPGGDFVISDASGGDPGPGGVAPRVGPGIYAGPSGLILTSRLPFQTSRMVEENEHFVRYELWDGPPEALESWEALWNGELRIDSGMLALSEYSAEHEPEEFEPFDLGETGVSWSVRVLTRVMTNTEEPDFPRDMYQVQLYRLQLWRPA